MPAWGLPRIAVRRAGWLVIGAGALASTTVGAQEAPVTLSFDAASRRLEGVSPAVSAADNAELAARETAAAVATLRRPIITASAQ